MNLSIINRSRSEISKAWVKSWVSKLASKIPELKSYSELSLVFVSSAEMKRLNKQYRGKDYATDVLSFEPVDFMSADGLWLGSAPKTRGSARKKKVAQPLGELVFCLSVIKRQAKSHDMSFEQELGYMIIHGILHLLGYEHENGGVQATKMYKLQDQTFAKMIRK